ncbi:MAG: SDR family NAD(P)-dependent oxidoreductase [Muribaculaceae bacterium]|nr:SDR family NAD(P)-dependent oxidoreductase [Muribaculaceae bacterium]
MLKSILKHIVYPAKSVSDKKLAEIFAGKLVVITGATSGIGEALTLRLIGAKANLFLIARNEEKLRLLCDKVRENGCEARYKAIDLRQREELDAWCETLKKELPHVSFLFCNAGKSIKRSIYSSLDRMHDFDRTMDLNYRSMVALSLSLIPSLREVDGHIVYTSSVSSRYPFAPGWSAYHASKCAANVWCRTARRERKKLGVKVQIAYMPLVHTPMSDVNDTYKNLPAFSADEAACILLKLAMSNKFRYKPWWAL